MTDIDRTPKKSFRIGDQVDYQAARGRTFISVLDERTVYFYFEGTSDVDSFELMRPALDEVAKSGKVYIFSDGEFNKASTPANREAWMKWFQAHPGKVVETNCLFPSAILQMALQVVTTITSEQMTYLPDANAFYTKLRAQAPSVIRHARTWPADISTRVQESAFGKPSMRRPPK